MWRWLAFWEQETQRMRMKTNTFGSKMGVPTTPVREVVRPNFQLKQFLARICPSFRYFLVNTSHVADRQSATEHGNIVFGKRTPISAVAIDPRNKGVSVMQNYFRSTIHGLKPVAPAVIVVGVALVIVSKVFALDLIVHPFVLAGICLAVGFSLAFTRESALRQIRH
jgi:hypothetical protein